MREDILVTMFAYLFINVVKVYFFTSFYSSRPIIHVYSRLDSGGLDIVERQIYF